MRGSAGGSGGTFAADSHGGPRPQTAEIIKTSRPALPNHRTEVAGKKTCIPLCGLVQPRSRERSRIFGSSQLCLPFALGSACLTVFSGDAAPFNVLCFEAELLSLVVALLARSSL